MPSGDLYGLRALVTGASKGIGEAVAKRLHGEGATVLTTARTAPSSSPEGLQFVAADLTSAEGCTTVAEAVAIEAAGFDAVVASGSDAGGHRGAFLRPVEESLVGTFSLVPQVADAVAIPVVWDLRQERARAVERGEAAQVDHPGADALAGELVGRLQRDLDHARDGDDRHVHRRDQGRHKQRDRRGEAAGR